MKNLAQFSQADLAQIDRVVKKLAKKGLTLATAESITGGGLASTLTTIPGASAVFLGGVVTYSDQAKIALLDIGPKLIKKLTAVSEEVAIAMAVNAATKFKTDFAISTTGVAGPGSAFGKKSGTAWIAIASKEKIGGRNQIKCQPIYLDFSKAVVGEKGVRRREIVRSLVIMSAISALERILNP
jgi:nicotinamide-nucleotide amidase